MVSINTNISSLLAQNNTRQVNNELEKAMERLSSGMRYSKKTANSKQSNKLPSKELILKLEKRNSELMKVMKTNLTRHKQTAELERAIQSDYVQKFWIGCKG